MSWPLASHFSAMVQNPRIAFRDPLLQACRITRDKLGQPRPWAGAFAVVYKGVDARGKAWAIRAFTSESAERRERYQCVTRHLQGRELNCLVAFEYRDDAIRSAGDGRWYPLVLMDWVEGLTLFQWVRRRCLMQKTASLAKIARHWLFLVRDLARAGIAHGDLQHANVLVTPRGRLKLVDYDGLCVPALAGRRNLEIGVAAYQHPERNPATLLSADLDRFSALAIYVALRALAADPGLWLRHVETPGHDKLLFRAEDFQVPGASGLYAELRVSPDPLVRDLATRLFQAAVVDMAQTPSLVDLVPREAWTKSDRARTVVLHPYGEDLATGAATDTATLVRLEIVSGSLAGQHFVMSQPGSLLFGRGDDCQVRLLGDPKVSRHHCILEFRPPEIRIRDLASRNGTLVNNVRHRGPAIPDESDFVVAGQDHGVALRDGDHITLGGTTVVLRVSHHGP